jgi:amino acid transporter
MLIAPIVGGVIGAAIFAFILYTGWKRALTRWRETDDPLQRAAQVIVAVLSNLGLLGLLAAGGAVVATFLVFRRDDPLLTTLALAGGGLFIGSFALGFLLAIFITGASGGSPSQKSRSSRAKRKRNRRQ